MRRDGKRGKMRMTMLAGLLMGIALAVGVRAQQPDGTAIIQRVDAAARSRYDHVLGFIVTEHYAVFRGSDETHPAAEMTVRTTYRKGVGKSYVIQQQSGSAVILKFGLRPLLDNEKAINDPAKVESSWFTSANYEMRPKPGETQLLDGRDCVAFSIAPRHKAPNMIDGTLWVDANDGSIVKVEGAPSKSPSIFAGSTKMMRQYKNISGYAMATHARAESNSGLFGHTVVMIDYSDYNVDTGPAR